MWNRGKLVIVIMVAVGLAAAIFTVTYHYLNAYRAGQFWGESNIGLIAEAPHAEAMRLKSIEPSPEDEFAEEATRPDGPAVEFDEMYWHVEVSHDAADAGGIDALRRGLVQDDSYDWSREPSPEPPDWQYAVEFNNGRLWATLLFDFETRQVALTGSRQTAVLTHAASNAWRQVLDNLFAAEAESDAKPEPEAEAEKSLGEEKPEAEAEKPPDEQKPVDDEKAAEDNKDKPVEDSSPEA